jgi:PPOX class probable F420-dependent enzyme
MTTSADLPDWGRDLIEAGRVGHLGLLDGDGRPRVLPVTYAVDHKPKRRAGEDLARVRWLRARPAAALTVDVYSDDWQRLAWVQALGDVEVVADPGPGVIAALADRYDQYRDRPPTGPYMRLVPRRWLCWRALD